MGFDSCQLVHVSQLRESFFATRQGQKIGLLTNMTVVSLVEMSPRSVDLT
jgi:hypothetical protein